MNIISTPKILVTCAIMAALISFCCVTAQVAANEYKHIPTSREELNNAERDLKVLKKRYPDIEESTFITDNIQAPLIKNNPDRRIHFFGASAVGVVGLFSCRWLVKTRCFVLIFSAVTIGINGQTC